MKFVLNKGYGGYALSDKAMEYLGVNSCYAFEDDRSNPALIKCVEELGLEASAWVAELKVIEIPDNYTDTHLDNYDGWETMMYVIEGKIHLA